MKARVHHIIILFGLIIVFLSAQPIQKIELEYPDYWPDPVYKFESNPLSESGIYLGRKLFYDPILSKDSSISCSSCHLSYTAFTHVDHTLSHGIKDKIGNRNSMALTNLAWSNSFMWDGAVHMLDVQALNPMTDSLEMGEDLENVLHKLTRSEIYPELFSQAFQDTVINTNYLLKALAQFQLSLVTSNSKYDKVKSGIVEFTEQESKGYELFLEHCNVCHTEPLFTSYNFENNGLPKDKLLNDLGRYNITNNPVDSLKFKIPSLRNIEYSYPYMHDGRFKNLKQVLKHYANGIEVGPNLGFSLKTPILLNQNDHNAIISFLLTLTDKSFLFDKNIAYPR